MNENKSVLVNKATFYNLEWFDDNIWIVLAQIAFLLYVFVFICSVDYKIIHTIWHVPKLHIQANIILCIILALDVAIYGQFVLSTTAILLQRKGKVWLNPTLCRLFACVPLCIIYSVNVILTIAAIEKVMYIIFPFRHLQVFSYKKLLTYILTSCLSILSYFIIYCASTEVYFTPAILGCFTKQMDAIIAIYLLPVFINGVCQTWIFVFSINKMIQHKPAWTPEYSINMKIFKNALVLFIITIINIVSCTLFLVIRNVQIPEFVSRILILFMFTAIPISNPFVILLGNAPVRQAILRFNNKISSDRGAAINTVSMSIFMH